MITFEQPEEGMRFLYDLVASDQTRDALARQAETNDFFKGIQGTLTDNPLPPFAVLSKYLAPGGSVLTDDDTGIHYMSFSLRRK